ncbi:LacI family transcriptional regulator [Mobilisporobacter senegalensis]|uniref:LacI family transcriptional regulator n=1 Tax=Mobilisporobacter senegalensis TaxID=1329262 RepID=A0A3N1XVR0_9FIRM|nr:LacI family DNA-binding transcriptional regulator [Mobilisporobacter senegalensis]ROR30699.1 LacI family transcriptional regulator [Mobilisporobacter senegalensis]
MKPSIRKISDITGFSPATISNALNHKKGVNKETAEEIFKVANEIGYVNESKILRIMLVIYKRNGSIIDNSPFFTNLLEGVESECRESGYEMTICNLDRRSDSYETRLEEILNDRSTAVIMLGTEAQDEDFERFKDAKCPIVILDSWSSSMDFNGVLINNSDSAKNAVQYLISKGHKEIGYLRGRFRIKAFSARYNGYIRALQKNNIRLREQYIVTLGTTMDGAYRDMIEYLENKPLLPTAFFADNDMIALGAMKALIEKGYRVPEDVSLIGFDDLASCEISTPRLSTIKVFKQEMGQLAVRRLLDVIRNETGIKTKTQVCTEFIERDSVKDLST